MLVNVRVLVYIDPLAGVLSLTVTGPARVRLLLPAMVTALTAYPRAADNKGQE